ncbi:MAG: KaiC/GvpD/RAD55 family RecA-like ATPase [Halobacteriales archaeon]|jgi:KaiC/GvpD/RAD55 family RecA-like ATPase
MDYSLDIRGTEERTIPGGTAILLLHPSTGETDRIDTDFLKTDTDRFLVVSTRTTAREVLQKLDYYDVDGDRAVILDTLSIERGYSRRSTDRIHYASAPDDLDGVVEQTAEFLESTDGKRRVSVDSITELAYYAGEKSTFEAIERLLDLLAEHDTVGIFHLSPEVHEDYLVDRYRELFDGVVELDADGTVTLDL